jgi:glutamate-1-semialdehyde 2,1-aminomutase
MAAPTRFVTTSGPRSRRAFASARASIPGGVNSPVRAFTRLGGQPPVMASGKGAHLVDVDGRRYIDYVLSWGPLLLGHAHPAVVRAVARAAKLGLGFGATTVGEGELARALCRALPGMERVRLVNSGTEATMSALRVARAATGRDVIVKFDGCYHGHADYLLVAAGSGLATQGIADSTGVPADFVRHTVSVPFNDPAAVERAFAKHRGRIAAVIVEPVAGNMGLVLPRPGFLEALRAITSAHGALLVFDEVMTGFRTAWGGFQRVCGVTPDLTCLGKVIGGGLPVGAYGGRADLMAHLAPLGACYQAGTLSGNPVSVAAGLATLATIGGQRFYAAQGAALTELLLGLRGLAARHGVPLQLAQAGTMWGFFFSDRPVTDFASAAASDVERWKRFAIAMLAQGIYLAPSPFEAAFWSSAHRPVEVRATLRAADAALEAAR